MNSTQRVALTSGATAEAILDLSDNMRQTDRDELEAAGLLNPYDTVLTSVQMSMACWSGLIFDYNSKHSDTICIFGYSQHIEREETGIPWMLCTDRARDFPTVMMKSAHRFIKYGQIHYDMLENYVSAKNSESIRFLEHLGFTIDDPVPWGIYGKPFCKFWMTGNGGGE